MSPLQYAKKEFAKGCFPSITIDAELGQFYLCDNNFKMLGGPAFSSRDAAEAFRSKTLDRARKVIKS